MTQKTITISGQEFNVSSPYAEGQTITAAEAKALNQVRAENIANNFRAKVKEAVESGASLEAVTADLTAYDASYVFTLASVGGGRAPVDPVEREAKKIAERLVADMIKEQKGVSKKDYLAAEGGAEKFAEAVAKVMENPKVIAAAKQAVKDQEKQKAALAGISLGSDEPAAAAA